MTSIVTGFNPYHDELGRFAEGNGSGPGPGRALGPAGALSVTESRALEQYTGSAYGPINGTLRGIGSPGDGEYTPQQIQHMTNEIDSAFANVTPLNTEAVVYRAMPDMGLHAGQTVTDKAFVSTTRDRSIAESFDDSVPIAEIHLPVGARVIDIGRRGLSMSPDEKEVLLSRGSRFRVTSVNPDEGDMGTIKMELLVAHHGSSH